MEELVQLRQMLMIDKTNEAIALIDELEEMSKRAIIRNKANDWDDSLEEAIEL